MIHPVGQFSARYGPGLSADVTRRIIAAVPQVVGWKMTYNYDGFREIAGVLRAAGRPVGIYGAVGKYFHENLANDTLDGTSAGSFNFALERMVEHISAWRKGDVARATEIWRGGLAALQDYIFSDFGRLHIRYKAATWLRGFIDNPLMRPPVPAPRRQEIGDLTRLLRGTDLTTRPDDEISELAAEFGLK
ncbi:dihydrodipicolinate synthase family protein [Amycolatopsis sp. FDAARGOS 1241]|uniref:dihydrodipicolinate synthase family protein n=1 Tax=Amycolatopsis sp. FDAARGOS 1241 TaxID=2778070 RepID=UPI00194EA9E4|nr:dihydrodipicolinate synthase family protein [Amycolatopsis sp. FDAARGOS 1241]QRP49466.1 dihydrodipicolinate synthase family protein [Amycolatopsis sp. FDAARGOS 1241]